MGTITALPRLIPHIASERVLSESLLNSSPPLTWQTSLTKERESPTCSQQTLLAERGIVNAVRHVSGVLLASWRVILVIPTQYVSIHHNLLKSCIQNSLVVYLRKKNKVSPNSTSTCLHYCFRNHSYTAD